MDGPVEYRVSLEIIPTPVRPKAPTTDHHILDNDLIARIWSEIGSVVLKPVE